MRIMGVVYNNEFGEWLRELLAGHGITSSRQVRQRTGISHTTIDDILKGTRPSVETAIRIATGFGEDISRALQLAGYDDIVAAWQGSGEAEKPGSEEPVEATGGEQRLSYEPVEDEAELVSYYRGLPPTLRPAAKATVKALHDAVREASEPTTYGRRPPEESPE
jgi:transcriptional regulator with XRE-family HTH domain